MALIRVGIIGLSSTAATGWASGAHLPYLLSGRGRARYEIVALCNSSEDAARRAIQTYKLPATTRAYGDPALLAADPDVDLVVVSTRVDNHHAHALPGVRAGKGVFVEWPLAHNAAAARELVETAAQAGGRTMVGVQGRVAPPLLKVREIIRQGRIGKVLSSEVRAFGGINGRDTIVPSLVYFADRTVGGNIYTIGFGHLFDQVEYVLGDVQDARPRFQIQRPELKILDRSTQEITGTVQNRVPDLVILTGKIPPSETVADGGATLYARFRQGPPFPGEQPLVWSINGEKGEIRLTARGGTSLHATAYTNDPDMGVVIELHDFASDRVETVGWAWADWQTELPVIARSVGMLYERFAAGADAKEPVPTFADALRSHEQLEQYLAEF